MCAHFVLSNQWIPVAVVQKCGPYNAGLFASCDKVLIVGMPHRAIARQWIQIDEHEDAKHSK